MFCSDSTQGCKTQKRMLSSSGRIFLYSLWGNKYPLYKSDAQTRGSCLLHGVNVDLDLHFHTRQSLLLIDI